MKQNKLILLAALVTLSGCNAVREVFDQGQFHTNEFKDNYYRDVPAKYMESSYEETVLEVTNKVSLSDSFKNINDVILEDISGDYLSFEQAAKLYGDETIQNLKESDFSSQLAYLDAFVAGMTKSNKATWSEYAKHNSLSTSNFGNPKINESFKRGIFSKLTDTLVLCDGSGSLVRMQVDELGMGQEFAYELIDYRHFILSARGGTNVDYATAGHSRVTRAKVKFNISFYIEGSSTNQKTKYTLSFIVNELNVDDNSVTTLMKINLKALFPNNELKRVTGITINYELLEHDFLKPSGGDLHKDYEFAMMLYEVMLPHSLWQ